MKNVLFIVLGCFVALPISAQINVSKVLEERNKVYSPEHIFTEKIVGDVDISVIPIRAEDLNEQTFKQVQPDISVFETLKAQDNTADNTLGFAYKVLENNRKAGKMSESTVLSLMMRLWKGEETGFTGAEQDVLMRKITYANTYNPFIYNNLSFTTFKVVFENKGKDMERIKLDEFQLTIGNEVLYPLKKNFFETQLYGLPEKMLNYLRLYTPDELLLLPQQRVEKYIAFPNIKSENALLQLQFVRDKKLTQMEFRTKDENTSKRIFLSEFTFRTQGFAMSGYSNTIYAVSFADGYTFALKGNKLFVPSDMMDKPATLYALSVNELQQNVTVKIKQNVIFSNIESRIINFNIIEN